MRSITLNVNGALVKLEIAENDQTFLSFPGSINGELLETTLDTEMIAGLEHLIKQLTLTALLVRLYRRSSNHQM